MFSPTVLGSYAQLIALPTEDEGQEIWQPDEREGGQRELQASATGTTLSSFILLSIATHYFVKVN